MAIIGLDCAAPRWFSGETISRPESAHGARSMGEHAVNGSSHYCACLDDDYHWKRPGRAGTVRVSESGGSWIRLHDHGKREPCYCAQSLGLSRGCGKFLDSLGVPQTYPPRAHHGITVGDFLAPAVDSRLTYPMELFPTSIVWPAAST